MGDDVRKGHHIPGLDVIGVAGHRQGERRLHQTDNIGGIRRKVGHPGHREGRNDDVGERDPSLIGQAIANPHRNIYGE